MPRQPDLAPLIALAREAGRLILEIAARGHVVRQKEDRSPVTEADEAAEAVIVAGLRRLAPGIPIVAEEMVAGGEVPEVGEAPFFLVDPLDGTKEFVAGRPEYSVNIALVENQRPVLGVVYTPGLDVLHAAIGGRAFRDVGRGLEPIRVRTVPDAGPLVLASRSHRNAEALGGWLAAHPHQAVETVGSAYKFCRLAEGTADVYPRLGPTSEWDTAAGQAVLEAAGGSVVTEDGRPLTYGKARFLNPHFFASGTARPA